jgi:hypothetical protein
MREITYFFEHYRAIARSIWSTGYWPVQELQNWDSVDQFGQVKKLLFKSLVIARLLDDHCCDLNSLPPAPVFHIVPLDPGPVPVMIERPRAGDRNHYWDDPVNKIGSGEAALHFVDYFDWDLMNYADLQFYRVRIHAFPEQPHLIGREALIDHLHAKVFVNLADDPTDDK